MPLDKMDLARELASQIPELNAGQLHWVKRVVEVFQDEHDFSIAESDLFDDETLINFGEAMRVHHSFSEEPFSKDKFEYVLVTVLKLSGQNADLAPKGNPGHDANLNVFNRSSLILILYRVVHTKVDKCFNPFNR